MGGPVLGFRQRSLHPWSRRIRDALRGRLGGRPPRSQRVYRVTIGGRAYKRVVFADSHQAGQVADRLRRFGPEGIYPALLLERERLRSLLRSRLRRPRERERERDFLLLFFRRPRDCELNV